MSTMNELSLHGLDLNLLVMFEVVMAEGSITRAAARLGRTQSAVSHALKRLRAQIGDPLLVKVDGRMRPSPFALALVEDVRPLLRSIQRVLTPPEPFEPRTSKRIFRIAIPAFTALVSGVFARVQTAAPRVSLEWISPNGDTAADVAEGLIDIGHVGGNARLPDGVEMQTVQPLTWLTFVRKDHPALSDWCIDTWTAWPHLAVSAGTDVEKPIDEVMSRLGKGRTIGARVPSFLGVAPLLADSNLLATFPPLALATEMRRYGLCARLPPAPFTPLASRFFWSSRFANDPGTRWIRGITLDAWDQADADARATLSKAELIAPSAAARDPRGRRQNRHETPR
jgi:DNA-binding transcriptional LysR family regulator